MRTVVFQPDDVQVAGGVAGACLAAEGWDYEAVRCAGSTGYGERLVEAWLTSPDGLIVVEDDVAPWPGALYELAACPRHWCYFDYPIGAADGVGHFTNGRGLGLVKFGPALVAAMRLPLDGWKATPWGQLDAAVSAACRDRTGMPGPHEHDPPVAHAQHLR